MSKKPTYSNVTNRDSVATEINSALSDIVDGFDNTLSLDGSTPNAMNADLDLNSNDLLNVNTANISTLVVDGTSLNAQVSAAAASATAAATSETNAATSETNAAASEAQAAISAASAATAVGRALFETVSDLITDNNNVIGYTGSGAEFIVSAGDIVEAGGFRYEVAASGALDGDETTAGGVKLYYRSGGFVGKSGKKYQVVSCVLRQDSVGSGWYALDDATHAPIGLDPTTPVSESSGNIVLNYDFTAAKNGSLLITPDESYSQTKLTFGASVGPSNATISLYHPFWVRMSGTSAVSHTYFGTKGVDWDAVNDNAAGTWTVTHPSESHPDATGSVVMIEGYGDDPTAVAFRTTARSKTGFTVEAQQPIHGKTNGATTVLTDNAGTYTASWDGTDTWTITHPATASAFDVWVSTVNPQYVPGVQSANTTQFTLKFYDVSTGAAYTGASIPTNIHFGRGGYGACALTGTTKFKAERTGPCKVDATNVSGGTKNLWVFGIFEVA